MKPNDQTSMSQVVNKGILCSESVKAKMNGYFVASLDRFYTKNVWCLLLGSYLLYPGQVKNYFLTQTHLFELSRQHIRTKLHSKGVD
jgi:hypothetical protein